VNGDDARRDFAAPRLTGEHAGLVLDHLDPLDEDDRRVLIEAEHPEWRAALDADLEVVDDAGREVNPRLHITLHEVVANQLLADDPPGTWRTAQRLTGLGYERHEVLHMLASVVTEGLHAAMTGTPLDPAESQRRLAALPDSWESQRADERTPQPPPRNRAERRARRRRHR